MTKRRFLLKHAKRLLADHNFIARSLPNHVLSKHKVKHEKKEVKFDRERETWQSGYKGDTPCTGKESRNYIDTFRVHDGARSVREKAWLRRKP